MFLHAQQGAFTAEARATVAVELTELGMAWERLIDTPQIFQDRRRPGAGLRRHP
jgi:hypothetical protein